MNLEENFQIKNGTEIYKEDLQELEELLKDGDIPGVYGMKSSNDKYLKFTFHFTKNGVKYSDEYSSIVDVPDKYENIEIISLDIEKRIYFEKSWDIIRIRINRNFIDIILLSDKINWIKTRRFLLENFFKNQQSKSSKANYWITQKADLFVSIIAGSSIGIAIATREYVFVAIGVLLYAISAFVTYPSIKRKYFPINKVILQKKTKANKEKKENKVKSFFLNGLINVFWGTITAFVVYFLFKIMFE